MENKFTQKAQNALIFAVNHAQDHGHSYIGSEHLLLGLMEERESIASISPSGWEYWGVSNNNSYDFIEDNYVYNRCHLIGFQLAGENDNELNLITGTRYMNIEGMLPFENLVADYIRESGNHVLYRVTPVFDGFNLVADGVLMEAFSVEDSGEGICFCIFAYNVQPGVWIDYFTGVNIPAELMN